MQFYFVRHGQSENNALWLRTGGSVGRTEDPPLTETGRQQAQYLARFLRERQHPPSSEGAMWDAQNVTRFQLTHLYTSLMIRSVATGMTVAHALDLPLVAWLDLHESGGIYLKDAETEERRGLPGKPRSYFETHYPALKLPDTLDESGWWNRPYETRELRSRRARRVLQTLLDRHGESEDRVAIISHGGFYNLFLGAVLDLLEHENTWFLMNNTAISRIDFNDSEVTVVYLNRVDFLPPELIT